MARLGGEGSRGEGNGGESAANVPCECQPGTFEMSLVDSSQNEKTDNLLFMLKSS